MSEINVPGEESTGSSDTETQKEPNDPMCDPVFPPYYVVFAQAHFLTPEIAFKSLPGSAFVTWIQDQWKLWEMLTGHSRIDNHASERFRSHLCRKYFPEAQTNMDVEITEAVYWEVDIEVRSRVRITQIGGATFTACLNGVMGLGSSNLDATENLFRKLYRAGMLNV